MSDSTRENSIVRIFNQNNKPNGAGFLISPHHILTCAHVINNLGKEITLDFPLLMSNEKDKYIATVEKCYDPIMQPKIKDIEDIAILKLNPDKELPREAKHAFVDESKDLYDHPVCAHGFSKNYNNGNGIWIDGKVKSLIDKGWIQVDQDKDKKKVDKGFSGAAVWDKTINAVVGMVICKETNENITTAYMIPISTLIEAWPELEKKHDSSRVPGSHHGPDLYMKCDRNVQLSDFRKHFKENGDKFINGQNLRQIYIIFGPEDECHSSLVLRFQREEVETFMKSKLDVTVKPFHVKVPISFSGDFETRKDIFLNDLFKNFSDDYAESDFSIIAFRALCEKLRLDKYGIIMISHDISASKWDKHSESLVKWYVNEYWAGFKSGESIPQFLLFFNVKYPTEDKTGIFKSLFKKSDSKKKVEESIEMIAKLSKETSFCLKIKELPRIESQDVDEWFSKYNVGIDDSEKLKLLKEMFKSKKEKRCMADVEYELKNVMDDAGRIQIT